MDVRKTGIALFALMMFACGKPSGDAAPAPAERAADSPSVAAPAAGGDGCGLIADASATLGQPVTAESGSAPNGTRHCDWKIAEGRLCGSVTVFGTGYNE